MLYPDISELHEFNAGLFYTLEPESSPGASLRSEDNIDLYQYFLSYVKQQGDMLSALVYAQNMVLPQLRDNLEHLTAEQLLTWIKAIHARAAKTVCELQEIASGSYASGGVLRWEHGPDFSLALRAYLSGQLSQYTPSAFANLIKKQFSVADTETALEQFILLLSRLRDDSTISFAPLPLGITNLDRGGVMAFEKLQTAYHTDGLLTDEEKLLVRKFVKVCIPPSQYEAAMQVYAQNTVLQLQNIDKTNVRMITETLSEIFYGFVEIHPFVNGNGRTATILTNLFLRALDMPSILLRYPGEKDDESSPYTQAFKQIESTRKPLADLIQSRIDSSQYKDKDLLITASSKVKMLELLHAIEIKHGTTIAKGLFNYTMQQFNAELNQPQPEKAIQKAFAEFGLSFIQKQTTSLKLAEIKENMQSKQAFLTPVLNHVVGEEKSWKFFNKGDIAYLELEDISSRDKIAELLNATASMKVTATRRSDTKIPVLKLETFHWENLLKIDEARQASISEHHPEATLSTSMTV